MNRLKITANQIISSINVTIELCPDASIDRNCAIATRKQNTGT